MKKYIVDNLGNQTITGNLSLDGNMEVQGSMKSNLVFNSTGATYPLQLSDNGKVVELSSSSTTYILIPMESSVPFPDGSQILLVRGGTGDVIVSGGPGTVLLSAEGNTSLNFQYSAATLVKKENDTWYLFGDLKA